MGNKQSVDPSQELFGGRGEEAAFWRGKMDAELLEALQALPNFSGKEEVVGGEGSGFTACVDYPTLGDSHTYFEGYFHACQGSESIPSLNPRNGQTMDKQAAPSLLRGLMRAVQTKNLTKLKELQEAVVKFAENEEEKELLSRLFAPLGDQLMCDLAMQIHAGKGVAGELLGWHTDSSNSLFHVALTIHGGRKLHSRVSATLKEGFLNKDVPAFVQTLTAGDVYISNPANFQHCVEFYDTEWTERSIAIQARILLKRDDYQEFRNVKKKGLSAAISKALREGFDWPSYAEVQAAMKELN
jgi:hypothetical protein